MLQMYKVFEPKKEVIFINDENQLGNSSNGDRNKNANENEVTDYVFSKEPYDELKKYYADHKLIKAAGGLVQNNGYFLWIYRNNICDLPKGKIEENESITDAALREVKEECGLKGNLEISHKIIVTHHTYQLMFYPDFFFFLALHQERFLQVIFLKESIQPVGLHL